MGGGVLCIYINDTWCSNAVKHSISQITFNVKMKPYCLVAALYIPLDANANYNYCIAHVCLCQLAKLQFTLQAHWFTNK